jgi:hypothetical protein
MCYEILGQAMSTPKKEIRELPKPIDLRRALDEALAKLNPLGEEYALIGGVALAYHGIERYTKDIDLAVTRRQCAAAETALADSTLRPLQIGGISIETTSGVRVDLIDRRFEYTALFEEAIREARRGGMIARGETREVAVVPLTYLVAMKMIADRLQDEADLEKLLNIEELDYSAARRIVLQHLGPYAAQRLDKLARAAHRKDAPPGYENGGAK